MGATRVGELGHSTGCARLTRVRQVNGGNMGARPFDRLCSVDKGEARFSKVGLQLVGVTGDGLGRGA